jgi:hypothetical protein
VTANPDGGWVTQQARNLQLVLGERGRQVSFLLRDRHAKFCRSFDVWVPKTLSVAWTCSFAPVVGVRDDRQS